MTSEDFIRRINKGDRPYDDENFSYLHYLEIDILDKLDHLENGIVEVLEHIEKENSVTLQGQKDKVVNLLGDYYKELKSCEKKYINRLDKILIEDVFSKINT